jgi:hypothetical protein
MKMKKLIMIVACMTSLNAFALDQSSSWSDIFANAYSVNALYDLGGIALGNACVTATEVKSIAPQRVCMKWEEIYTPGHGEMGPVTEYVCKQWGTADFASPRTYTKTECLKYGNGEAHPRCPKRPTTGSGLPCRSRSGTRSPSFRARSAIRDSCRSLH